QGMCRVGAEAVRGTSFAPWTRHGTARLREAAPMAQHAYIRRITSAAGWLALTLASTPAVFGQGRAYAPPPETTVPGAARPVWMPPPEEDAVFQDAAKTAMAYMQAHRSSRTGLVAATPGWENITLWDVGSLVGAVYAGGELGLLSPAERDAWMSTLLR